VEHAVHPAPLLDETYNHMVVSYVAGRNPDAFLFARTSEVRDLRRVAFSRPRDLVIDRRLPEARYNAHDSRTSSGARQGRAPPERLRRDEGRKVFCRRG
jgi:hypothetical protein